MSYDDDDDTYSIIRSIKHITFPIKKKAKFRTCSMLHDRLRIPIAIVFYVCLDLTKSGN